MKQSALHLNFIGFAFLLIVVGQLGCAGNKTFKTLQSDPAWRQVIVNAPLPAVGWVRGQADTIHIYIEGDGVAYASRHRPSLDPTPRTPTGLLLAHEDNAPAVSYLGRPCQYVTGEACSPVHWTTGRFSETVLQAQNQLVDEAKGLAGAKRVVLFGYSGGGAVAALLAARRTDVDLLVTICGNLDHAAWTRLHGLTPLDGSLNPASIAERLSDIPQVHYVGSKDTIVPPEVVQSFVDQLLPETLVIVKTVDGADHGHTGWVKVWQEHSHPTE
ncbi:alpha/beta hydrolase [Pseudodesulfovibrio sp. F-1]|uniref:Alpha/beta hydrolase n=1 Tax=Pseudodesulfovibrio alkaliphilus TaxID=2661613 RepID=A0A7K1KPI2_9BACT|nr:alpha/beta hydrolase [Pseudodesulfovibrio alkaliphilus]MUM77890.1 alpha/beta hydrolase [Pseudodesulfovibrio alkaliphilus]